MPHPERRPRRQPDPEREALPRYTQSARFPDEQTVGAAYFEAQEVLFTGPAMLELSACRVLLGRVPHVAVLGDPPPQAVHEQLRAVLATGEPAALCEAVLTRLHARRQEQTKHGPWVERHHRPG